MDSPKEVDVKGFGMLLAFSFLILVQLVFINVELEHIGHVLEDILEIGKLTPQTP